jgi:vancomycin resistance protein VanJ
VWAAAAVVLPWLWFAVRSLGFVSELAATGLPVLYAGAVVVLGIVAGWRRRPELAAGAVSFLLAATVAVVGPWRARPTPGPAPGFRIVSANVRSGNPQREQAVDDALRQHGDLVLLIEAGKAKFTPPPEYATVIRPQYSSQVILARLPTRLLDRPAGWPSRLRAHRLEVEAPGGRVIVYLAHLVRPHLGPTRILKIRSQLADQRREREALLRSAKTESAPVILAGDFNTPDRSRGYRRIASRLRDAMRAKRAGPTYVAPPWRPFLLRIDHVFVPPGWCAARPARFGLHGSDHRGIAVDVGPCPKP